MSESIRQRLAELPLREQREVIALFDALLTDVTNLRTAVTTLTAKLDADAGITDTDYAATVDPAALNTTS